MHIFINDYILCIKDKEFMKVLKKHKNIVILILLTLVFFSSSLVITSDSTHYLKYVNILEHNAPFSSWDIVRGPIFPIIISINNFLFGRSGLGMMAGMYIFYLLYCLIIYAFSNILFKKSNHKNILITVLCIFCIVNPLILGYFHTMLTEYVAITLTMGSLYMGWKWYQIKTRKEQILYGLYFCFGISFSYFLKQPYICCVLIPMVISIAYSLIINKKNSNKTYYFGTLFIAIIMLIISSISWNKFLEIKGVNLKTGRDSSGMLSTQLLNSIDGYKITKINNYEKIKNDKYLTKTEKKAIKKELQKHKKVMILNIYNGKKLLEKDFLRINKGNKASGKDTILEIANTFFKHPSIVIRSYSKNYCGLSSICIIESEDGIQYHVTDKMELIKMFENEIIPFKSFRYEDKYIYYPPERKEFVDEYIFPINQGLISKLITYLFLPTSILFKLVTFLSLIYIIILVTIRIIFRKCLKKKELYLLSLMFLSFSFLTIVANALSGAMIDRYSVICFIPGLLGFIGTILFTISNLNKKEKINKKI